MGPLGGIYRTRKPAFKTLLTTNIPKKSHFCKYIPGIENAWLGCVCVIYNNVIEWNKTRGGCNQIWLETPPSLWEIVWYGQTSAVRNLWIDIINPKVKNTQRLYHSSIKCLSNIIYECDDLNLDSNAFHGQMDRTLFLLL